MATEATKRKNFVVATASTLVQLNDFINRLDDLYEEFIRAGYGEGSSNPILPGDLQDTEVGHIHPTAIGTAFYNWTLLRAAITEPMRQAFEALKP